MMKLDYNFHTHTSRCGHAIGDDEGYVLAAIDNGYKVLGFSDHTFVKGFHNKRVRMDEVEFPNYLASINHLKEQYKDKIDIHIGLEVEYYPNNFPYIEKLLDEGQIEYMILGQHFRMNNLEDGQIIYNDLGTDEDALKAYVKDVIDGLSSGKFLYLAHPDLYSYFYHKEDEFSKEQAERIIKAAIENDTALELNISKLANNIRCGLDMFDNYTFPLNQFWTLAGKLKAEVVIGLDAHTRMAFYDSPLDFAYSFAKKHKLHILTKEEILEKMKKKNRG